MKRSMVFIGEGRLEILFYVEVSVTGVA